MMSLQREYEAARRELEEALAGGTSVEALRAQLLAPKKQAQAAAAQAPQKRVRIERKQWDPSQLINAPAKDASAPGTPPPAPSQGDVAAGAGSRRGGRGGQLEHCE